MASSTGTMRATCCASSADYQRPPAFSIAARRARLEGVRRVPVLWGTLGSPASNCRRPRSAANSVSGIGWSVVEVGGAIGSCHLVADALIHIVQVGVGMKAEQVVGLWQHVGGAARGTLVHAVGDQFWWQGPCALDIDLVAGRTTSDQRSVIS